MGDYMQAFRDGFFGAFRDARTVVAWPLAWGLFWLGHATSRVFLRFDATAFMYPVYSRLMCASLDLQEWAGGEGSLWPWQHPTPPDPGHRRENDND